jgi:Bacterial oxidoreductases, C-terminal
VEFVSLVSRIGQDAESGGQVRHQAHANRSGRFLALPKVNAVILCTPTQMHFRYIGDTATSLARYDDLFTGKEEKIDAQVAMSMNGIELQDREFSPLFGRPANPMLASERFWRAIRCWTGWVGN